MIFNDVELLNKSGFSGFKSMEDLFSDSSMIPDTNGVYLVLALESRQPEFVDLGTGGFFKGKNPNVSINELRRSWVEDTIIIYIGKATSLKKRLRQYFAFGQGKDVGHYGGRYIWQLKYSRNLVVCWKSTTTDPRIVEAELIRQFVQIYGSRPFANLKG